MEPLLVVFMLGVVWASIGWVYAIGFYVVSRMTSKPENQWRGVKHYFVGVAFLFVVPLLIQANKGMGFI